jgi:hypothetical protein
MEIEHLDLKSLNLHNRQVNELRKMEIEHLDLKSLNLHNRMVKRPAEIRTRANNCLKGRTKIDR